jgi:hypothetical protein
MAAETPSTRPARHRPRTTTVFVAAFVAGAAAAVGVNRALDVHLAQAKPQVECEPIFVALRALPSGSPITVWDVALRDLPKAMVPATALRVTDSFEGRILKFPLREGQPLVSGQLVPAEPAAPAAAETPDAEPVVRQELVEEAFVAPVPATTPVATRAAEPVAEPRDVVTREPVFNDEPTSVDEPSGDDEPSGEAAPEPVASATAAPVVAPAAEIAGGQPTPAPTVAEPTPAATIPEPARPEPEAQRQSVAAAPAKLPLPTDESDAEASVDLDAALDMPSRPAVDVSSLPSVMARDAAAAPLAEDGESGRGVRYLVVPERIARQADTSFTTPSAPGTGMVDPTQREAAPTPQTSGQTSGQASATRTETEAVRQTQQAQVPKSQTEKAPMQRAQTQRAPTQKSQQGQVQQGKARDAKQAQPQPRSRQAGTRSSAQAKPTEPAAAADQQTPSPRAWGGMFPNVSAGLEAMGGWRSSRTPSGQSAAGSTTR